MARSHTPEPGSPRRERTALALALALHGGLLALVLPFAVRAPAPPPPEPPPQTSRALIDIELPDSDRSPPTVTLKTATLPTASPDSPPADSASPFAGPDAPLAGAAGSPRGISPDLPPGATAIAAPESTPPGTASPGATAAPGAPTGTTEYDSPPSAVPMPGGGLVTGTPIWAVPGGLPGGTGSPGPAAPTGAPASTGPLARVTAAPGATVLRDTVRARDADLGLGTPGATAVANAVADAVRASQVPNESSAVLVARIGGDGVLVSLGVQQMSAGDARSWNGVAAAATAALGKKKLPLAGLGPGGALVQVAVQSTVVKPSGGGQRGLRMPSLTEGPPRDVMPAPSPDGDSCAPERRPDLGTLCGVGAKVGTFDVTDLATKPHRNVATRLQVKLLDSALALAPAPAAASSATPSSTPSAAAIAPSADAGAP